MEELKQVVFSMSPHSAAGPDSMNIKFFQSCWDIIKYDLVAAVNAFFCGYSIPKYFSHASLVLLPKFKNSNRLS